MYEEIIINIILEFKGK